MVNQLLASCFEAWFETAAEARLERELAEFFKDGAKVGGLDATGLRNAINAASAVRFLRRQSATAKGGLIGGLDTAAYTMQAMFKKNALARKLRLQKNTVVFIERANSGNAGSILRESIGNGEDDDEEIGLSAADQKKANNKWLQLCAEEPAQAFGSLFKLLGGGSFRRAAARFCLIVKKDTRMAEDVFTRLLTASRQPSVIFASLREKASLVAADIDEALQQASRDVILKILRGNLDLIFRARLLEKFRLRRLIVRLIEGRLALLHAAPIPLASAGPLRAFELRHPHSDGRGAVRCIELSVKPRIVSSSSAGSANPDGSGSGAGGIVAGVASYARRKGDTAMHAAATATSAAASTLQRFVRKRRTGSRSSDASKDGEAAASGGNGGHQATQAASKEADEAPPPRNPADAYLQEAFRCIPPLGRWLQDTLPPWYKAMLPFERDPSYEPDAVRENPSRWIKLDVRLAARLDFGEKDVEVDELKVGVLYGAELIAAKLEAHATLWWDCFGSRLLVAFRKDKTNEFIFDQEVALCPCGMPLPSLLEDRLPSAIAGRLFEVFNATHPIEIDLSRADDKDEDDDDDLEDDGREAATMSPPRGDGSETPASEDEKKAAASRLQRTFRNRKPKQRVTADEDATGKPPAAEAADATPSSPSTTPAPPNTPHHVAFSGTPSLEAASPLASMVDAKLHEIGEAQAQLAQLQRQSAELHQKMERLVTELQQIKSPPPAAGTAEGVPDRSD